MSEGDNLLRGAGAAVRLGRRYGDAMNSVPLILTEADILPVQAEPRHRALALALIGLSGLMLLAITLIVSERSEELSARHVASAPPMSAVPIEQPKTYMAPVVHGLRRPIEEPGASALAEAKPHPTESIRRLDEPHTLPPTPRDGPPRQNAVTIEPYRNGTAAKRLYGEELKLALIEDRRLTREMNQATLRALVADGKAAESSTVSDSL